jgi:hypothetical protein
VQPSAAANLDVQVIYGLDSDSDQASIPLASINPIMFLPGTTATIPPDFNGSLFGANTIIYNKLYENFEKMGYEQGSTLFQFPWDWLTSHLTSVVVLRDQALVNATSAAQSVPWVDTTSGVDFDLIGHSAGGLIARAYVQADIYNNNVDRLITIATPWQGLVGAYETWEGLESILNPVATFFAEGDWIPSRALDAGYDVVLCFPFPIENCYLKFVDTEEEYAFTHDPINGISNLPELLVPFGAAADPYLQNTNLKPVSPTGNYPYDRQANTLLDCQTVKRRLTLIQGCRTLMKA